VTVVDALRFREDFLAADYLAERELAAHEDDDRTISDLLIEQVEFADTLLLNKCDLVDEATLLELEALLRRLNPEAKILRSAFGRVPLSELLETRRFDFERASRAPGWLATQRALLRCVPSGKSPGETVAKSLSLSASTSRSRCYGRRWMPHCSPTQSSLTNQRAGARFPIPSSLIRKSLFIDIYLHWV
jgi:G3E family GTPase